MTFQAGNRTGKETDACGFDKQVSLSVSVHLECTFQAASGRVTEAKPGKEGRVRLGGTLPAAWKG